MVEKILMDSNDSEVFQCRRTVKKTLMDSLNKDVLQWTVLSMLNNSSCESHETWMESAV